MGLKNTKGLVEGEFDTEQGEQAGGEAGGGSWWGSAPTGEVHLFQHTILEVFRKLLTEHSPQGKLTTNECYEVLTTAMSPSKKLSISLWCVDAFSHWNHKLFKVLWDFGN